MLNIGSGRKRKKGKKKETLQAGRVSQVEAENALLSTPSWLFARGQIKRAKIIKAGEEGGTLRAA